MEVVNMEKKLTKVLLFSGGSDSVLNYYLTNPDYLVYVNIHGKYSEEEIKKIKSSKFADKVKIIDFPFLGKYERESDAIVPLRNLYLPMIICNEFPADEYGDLVIILNAGKGDRVLDKSPKFAEYTSELLTYLYSPQHWIPEGRKVTLDVSSKKYTKTELLKKVIDLGYDVDDLLNESFSCYDPIDGQECWCKNGICKPCFRKYVSFKLNGAHFKPEIDVSVCEAIKAEILPSIQNGTYGRGEEEQEILEVLKIYEKEHPENIGKLLYKNTNHRHQ